MPSFTSLCHPEMIDVEEKATGRILEQAIRVQAHVNLLLKVAAEATAWFGYVLERRDGTLRLAVRSAVLPPRAADAACEITIHLHGRAYFFNTSFLETVEEGHRTIVTVAAPATLHTPQRRRFLRARVADTTAVHVSGRDAFDGPWFSGVLLNVSRDGLACRVERRAADQFAVDGEVGVSFVLGAPGPAYRLNAAIKAKTPAATPGQIILRLQFLRGDGDASQFDRLAEALKALS